MSMSLTLKRHLTVLKGISYTVNSEDFWYVRGRKMVHGIVLIRSSDQHNAVNHFSPAF